MLSMGTPEAIIVVARTEVQMTAWTETVHRMQSDDSVMSLADQVDKIMARQGIILRISKPQEDEEGTNYYHNTETQGNDDHGPPNGSPCPLLLWFRCGLRR